MYTQCIHQIIRKSLKERGLWWMASNFEFPSFQATYNTFIWNVGLFYLYCDDCQIFAFEIHAYLYVQCNFHILVIRRKKKKNLSSFAQSSRNFNAITMIFKCRLCFLPQVTGIPTVLVIKNGKVVDRFTGLLEKEELRRFVEKFSK